MQTRGGRRRVPAPQLAPPLGDVGGAMFSAPNALPRFELIAPSSVTVHERFRVRLRVRKPPVKAEWAPIFFWTSPTESNTVCRGHQPARSTPLLVVLAFLITLTASGRVCCNLIRIRRDRDQSASRLPATIQSQGRQVQSSASSATIDPASIGWTGKIPRPTSSSQATPLS